MLKNLIMAPAACALVAAASGQGLVINVDVGNGAPAYVGQGVVSDPGNNFWNGINDIGSNLIASNGMATTVSVALATGGGFGYNNANGLLADYQFMSAYNGTTEGGISITGLLANTEYLIYVYSAGDQVTQGGIITLNGVRGTTAGSTSDQFLEGLNYTVLDVKSDGSGVISGLWQGFDASAAINGFQIVEGAFDHGVQSAAGAESPVVHSPGDMVPVTLSFNDTVTLSAVGGAEVVLNFGGTLVTAAQTGATTGTSLTFEGVAPSVTTADVKVVANSLQLVGAATLIDSDMVAVVLAHDEQPLPFDGVSVDGLSVYPMVPGLDPSPHYRFRVREIGGAWEPAFAWFTKCIDKPPVGIDPPYGYYQEQIGGWSHTYCNFEMADNVPVEVEITHIDATGAQIDIKKSTPHPRRKVKDWRIQGGKAYVTFDKPTLFAVDIDGQMDDNVTPSAAFLNETALHGVSIFANPIILDKPDITDPDVLVIEPGDTVPDNGAWTTLYFKPGVHTLFPGARWAIGDDFRVRSDRSYYIPGDAIVHGNMNNGQDDNDARNIRIFGHGTLSGERIDHPIELGVTVMSEFWHSRPVHISSRAQGCSVQGITITDSAHHSCEIKSDFYPDPADANSLRWCKAITWRANGDGMSPNGSSVLEDCFLRTQDDGTYVLGDAIRRIVYWSDANGMPLRCSNLVAVNEAPREGPLYVDDCDVIYARSAFGPGPGRSIIGFPDPAAGFPGSDGDHVVFRNLNVEDPLPTRRLFGWDITLGDTAVSSVRFENVRAQAQNVDGDTEVFLGGATAPISGLTFQNVTLAGEQFDDASDFELNPFVTGLSFEDAAPETITYVNASGYGKWHLNGDWATGVEPANNDVVNHTAVGGEVDVDALSYAGTLNVSHAGTATVSVRAGGRLIVTDAVSIGANGAGEVRLMAGPMQIENSASNALSVGSGGIHLKNGRLRWAGDHVSDIKALHAAGGISFADGRPMRAIPRRQDLVAAEGANLLFARFNATTGYTSVWTTKVKLPQVR